MIPFWLTLAAMTLAALFFVILPLLGRGRRQGIDRQALNVAIFRERLAELERQRREEGMSERDFALARAELERELLIDVSDAETQETQTARRGLGIGLSVILLPPLALGLYHYLGSPDMLTLTAPPARQAAGQQTVGSVDEMTLALAARLRKNPDNPSGWYLLGRSYMAMERHDDAIEAFAEAYRRGGDYAPLLADYAEALALGQDGKLEGRPSELLARALQLDPENHKALLLSGMAAYQAGDGMQALRQWLTLFRKFPANSESANMVKGYMMDAAALLTPAQREQFIAELQQRNSRDETASEPGRSIVVRVSLDPALAAEASPDDTVFVFARAAQGPRMPLAIVRRQVRDLPLTVTLDDSQAMMPDLKLSSFPQVVVGARISKSGNAIARPGDLEGISAPLGETDQQVAVVIDARK